tara:strand:+ start:797 stop:1672 length:876 start_codon:yes stop_codon:yes gene_type:complete
MAVKPITNKQVVNKQNINRANQTTLKNTKNRSGNRASVQIPGKNFTKNYAITLKDIDTSVLSHVKNIMRPTIKEANEMIKVNVMYGNEERWKSVRKRGVMRDKNGSIILPLVMLRRTSVEKSQELPLGFEHDVKRQYAEVVRTQKWSKNNRYDRFSVQQNKNPVIESYVTTMPNFVNITYEFILWTNFIEQMNPLVESFIEQNNTYWGNSTDYKFLCVLDSIADASEMTVDTERVIKSTFSVITKAYLLPEETNSAVMGKMNQLQKRLSPSKVIFGYEGDASAEQINGNKK